MGACLSSPCGGDASSAQKKTLTLDSSCPSNSQRWSSKRWKMKKMKSSSSTTSSGARDSSEKRGGSISDRISGIIDFGYLLRGGSVGGDEELSRIPGRMFANGSSNTACLLTQQGKKGTNQDAMLVWEKFCSRDDTIFCGVFDGHGPFGHMVAKKVRDSLPVKLSTHWKANASDQSSLYESSSVLGSMNSEETASISMEDEWVESFDADENEKLPEMYTALKQAFLKSFKLMDKELKLHPTIDCFCSGSTAVTLVKQGQDLVIGNVGDSRAVLGTRDKDNSLIAEQLTVDLKPNLPREAARIQQCKGRVFALQDEPEVARVWLPNNDSPGLAMARAFGDFCLKDFGLISVPDISYRYLTERDEFIVLATDGVWDVLSNKEVVDIVASAPSRSTSARALVDYAVRAWRFKFPTSKIDDCAVVCLFLDPPSSSDQGQESALKKTPKEAVEMMVSASMAKEATDRTPQEAVVEGVCIQGSAVECMDNIQGTSEIMPVSEPKEEKLPDRCHSTRSLAECISNADEEEWSALEGFTRVNSLLNLPRFGSGDKKSRSWRKKWL
ncbi:probable protein phosphatase 2C 66 [Magnolia sinica]|uniref:probable protein phosphatase 2C 66 n=1 Tax=Magnolia sinica TaxID=86752 RepID=UPI002659A785|nr:probable protein phosphatase 2C 66 [Magnolia sinica]